MKRERRRLIKMSLTNKRVIFLVMILLTGLSLLPLLGVDEYPARIEDGYLKIDESALNPHNIITLNGDWTYYDQHFTQESSVQELEQVERQTIHIPSEYSRGQDNNISKKGFGTLALTLELPEKPQYYGLDFKYIGTAYQVYINGDLYGGVGEIAKDYASERALYSPKTIFFRASGQTLIEVQFSAFKDTYTFLKTIQFGRKEAIEHYKFGLIGRDFISITLIFFLGFINLSFYLVRPQMKWTYYFSIFAFLMGIRSLVVNQRVLQQLLPTVYWEVTSRIAYLPMFIGLYYFTAFLKSRAPHTIPDRLLEGIRRLTILLTVLGFILPASVQSDYLLVIVLLAYGLVIILGTYKSTKHYLDTREDLSLCISMILMVAILVNDYLANYLPFSIPYMTATGMILFFLIQGTALSQQFGLLLTRAEAIGEENRALADELTIMNESLESIVAERTEALTLKKRELEISNTKLKNVNKHLENLSFIDELTKIPNRRMFFNEVDKGFMKTQRQKGSMVVLVIDIDHFKRYNDFYGHVKGDWCLFNIAQTIEDISNDLGFLAARYGGEEFIVAGFNKSREEGLELGHRLRDVMTEMSIEHGDSDVAPVVTLSIGGVFSDLSGDETIMTLVDKADNLLYQAKSAGRNKFFI
jgi:diguanylate cyclase (GGDEF)-like protein